jgi:hypothetical protein
LIEFESEQMIIRDGRRLIIVPERLRSLGHAEGPPAASRPAPRGLR